MGLPLTGWQGLEIKGRPSVDEVAALIGTDPAGCSAWQSVTDDPSRFDLIEEVHDIHDDAIGSRGQVDAATPRFTKYGERFSEALEKVQEHPRFMASPARSTPSSSGQAVVDCTTAGYSRDIARLAGLPRGNGVKKLRTRISGVSDMTALRRISGW